MSGLPPGVLSDDPPELVPRHAAPDVLARPFLGLIDVAGCQPRRLSTSPDLSASVNTKVATGDGMRRAMASIALPLFLLGCGSANTTPNPTPNADPDAVQLVTDDSALRSGIGCWLMPSYGELVADSTLGVVFKDTGQAAVWPTGYTGRRVGSEVEVLDRQGKVVATTGLGLQQLYWADTPGSYGPGSSTVLCWAYRAGEHPQP